MAEPAAPPIRKVIQIAIADQRFIHALCDDGTIWRGDTEGDVGWHLVPPVPQDPYVGQK
jgi:hypothetical protein